MFFHPNTRARPEPATHITKAFIVHCVLVLTAAAASVATAYADEAVEVVPTTSLTVAFDDLNLNKYEDAVAMYDRLNLAAARVCTTQRGVTLRERQQFESCVARAMATSIARLDRPVLSRYAQERSGQTGEPRVAKR